MPYFQDIVSTVAAPVVAGVNMLSKAINPASNPVLQRLMTSGLVPGAKSGSRNSGPSVNWVDGSTGQSLRDWKVRLTIKDNSIFNLGAGQGVLDPLVNLQGVVFPYTPQITVSNQANYHPQKFTHSNYAHFAYDNSEVQQIQIQAEFTAQNREEASYVLACIYFFRAATKMFFGESQYAGNPPPLVFLNGYGEKYFKDVPCLIVNFSHTMPSDVDYIDAATSERQRLASAEVDVGSGESIDYQNISQFTKVPTISSFNIGLQPVYSKTTLTKFNLQQFAQGKLVDRGFI